MTCKQLFRDDAYLRSCTTRVVVLSERGIELEAPAFSVGDTVSAEIDWERRYAHMRVHTDLHVLSCVVEARAGCACSGFPASTSNPAVVPTCVISPRSVG